MVPTIRDGQFAEVGDGIRLHYASCGEPGAPLVLCLHGFPEFWGAWRDVLPALGREHFVVAPDLRGYNLSSKPDGVAAYHPLLHVADLIGLVDALGYHSAAVVGHDWGGAIAWAMAMVHPARLQRLVILNSPHPVAFARALAGDPAQQAASAYMIELRADGAEARLSADDFARLDGLFGRVGASRWFDEATRADYHRAWSQPGALTGMLNLYRASPLYPPTPDDPGTRRLALDPGRFRITVPTRIIWGERDRALLPVLLDGIDAWIDDLHIERIADASHWLIHEQPDRVTAAIRAALGPLTSDRA